MIVFAVLVGGFIQSSGASLSNMVWSVMVVGLRMSFLLTVCRLGCVPVPLLPATVLLPASAPGRRSGRGHHRAKSTSRQTRLPTGSRRGRCPLGQGRLFRPSIGGLRSAGSSTDDRSFPRGSATH